MNLTTKTLFLAIPAALAMSPVAEEIDLAPRFAKGQTITITNTMSMEMGLDDISATMDGQEMLAGAVEFDMEMAMDQEISEEILEVRDGQIAKMRVTMDTLDMEITGEVSAMGEGESIDESPEMPIVGRTIEISIDEDGSVARKDVTEDAEPLSDAEMAAVTHMNHFEILAPAEKVELDKEFEIKPDWDTYMAQALSNMDSAEMPPEMADAMEGIMETLFESTEIGANGKVTKLEDGIATVEYEMDMTTTIDDLMEMMQGVMPPEAADQMPPINANLEMSVNATGLGLYDVALGQFKSLEMGGEFEVSFAGDADLGGAAGEASATMSGEFTFGTAISVE